MKYYLVEKMSASVNSYYFVVRIPGNDQPLIIIISLETKRRGAAVTAGPSVLHAGATIRTSYTTPTVYTPSTKRNIPSGFPSCSAGGSSASGTFWKAMGRMKR